MASPDTQLLRLPEVAERLALSRRSTLDLIHEGAIEAVNVGRGAKLPSYRVTEAALRRYLNARLVQPRRKP